MKCLVSAGWEKVRLVFTSTGPVSSIKEKEKLTMCHETAEVAAHDAVPGRALALIKLSTTVVISILSVFRI